MKFPGWDTELVFQVTWQVSNDEQRNIEKLAESECHDVFEVKMRWAEGEVILGKSVYKIQIENLKSSQKKVFPLHYYGRAKASIHEYFMNCVCT